MKKELSHINASGDPYMVDVGEKKITRRTAIARSIVLLPAEALDMVEGNELQTKKGPVFQTAILAGIMGVKKTSELIPLCHPLAINKCNIDISISENREIIITSEVRIDGKTGVEMEALTGASIAALTVYDMCKSLGHDIVISRTELVSKTGGKSDYQKA